MQIRALLKILAQNLLYISASNINLKNYIRFTLILLLTLHTLTSKQNWGARVDLAGQVDFT